MRRIRAQHARGIGAVLQSCAWGFTVIAVGASVRGCDVKMLLFR